MSAPVVLEFPGMPVAESLHRVESGGQVVVRRGGRVLFVYDAADTGMRNLAVVAVTEAGVSGREAAACFGLSEQYVSSLRGRAYREGSAGLVKAMGRPPKLSARQQMQARRWAGQGWTQQQIAERLGISRPQISDLLARHGPIMPPAQLPGSDSPVEPAGHTEYSPAEPEPEPEPEPESAGGARIGTGSFVSRYAGVMLGHAFLSRVGAENAFAQLAATMGGRYDDPALLCALTLSFGLGVSSLEQVKHLTRAQAGPVAGLVALPELRTLRPRLAAIADGCDPLAVQRELAAAMLRADAPGLGVYYVDDHFVPYGGSKPVGRGWNNKRKQAQRGRGDTLVTDYRGRAVAFVTGEPSGLSVTLPKALEQLQAITGKGTKLMLGFDRGGAYPGVFTTCRKAGVDWITYRRSPLKVTLVKPTTRPYPPVETETEDSNRGSVDLADEIVEFKDYGPCRQLTLFEGGMQRLQVLTSDLEADGPALLAWLRSRWRIENAIKDLSRFYGIDWLCDYRADLIDDDTPIDNPARKAALHTVHDREKDLAKAERDLAQLVETPLRPIELINRQIPQARRHVAKAQAALTSAKTAHKSIPATIPANQLKPGAQRALPQAGRRSLQMVLRLLAYNTELWLADHLNTHLRDDNEYRAATRNLLHLGGVIDYRTTSITVTLEAPDSPRLRRALTALITELNEHTITLPGDGRPITYKINIQH
jgi:transposase